MNTWRPDTSRASRAIFTPSELMRSTSSSRKREASLRLLAPNVLVSISSAPARMKPRCNERTLSGARTLASSGQRKRGTALVISEPMPPSQQSGGPAASRSMRG